MDDWTTAPQPCGERVSDGVRSAPIPSHVGKYEVSEQIGSGGFGRVFKAWDPLIRRAVAIKTCEVASPEVRARFFREAQLAGNLQHANITTIYELALEDDMPFLVQEFLSGDDLSVVAAERDLSILEKLDILIGIATGLQHAHEAGVIHRDVKPGNVRVIDNLAIKIMDFGIARSIHSDANLTRSGVTLGSAAYMSPEQIRGEELDARTDVFSLGVVAYELVAGVKPFLQPEVGSLLDTILQEEPQPLADAAPQVPGSVAAIVDRALAKKREDRYASMEEMRRDLVAARRELLEAAGISDSPVLEITVTAAAPALSSSAIPREPGSQTSASASPSPLPAWVAAALLLLAAMGAGILMS